jgi:hypothetical protein
MAANTASVEVQEGADTATIVYAPSELNDKTLTDLDGAVDVFTAALSRLIRSWDVFEDDAQTREYPIDTEHLSALGLGFRIKVARAIVGDVRPNARTAQATA